LISVIDRGSGLAAGDLSKLFGSFFSTKRTGMGLGLSIARTIVEAHGGTICAERGASGGAIFRVELPAQETSENAA
jgi:signal transduction histidine kinase